jgi:hypothetical protein
VQSHFSAARIKAGLLAGLAGGAAFAAVMQADMAASKRRVDDFRLLADWGPLHDHWRITGPAVHAVNSAIVGAVYSAAEPSLRGPGWVRGATFALVENLTLWPVLFVLDRVHPAIRAGDLPEFGHRWPFVVETLRHLAYGLTLGVLFPRILRRS